MSDWFADFAEKPSTRERRSRATGATRATPEEYSQKNRRCTGSRTVAQSDSGKATRATTGSQGCPVQPVDESVARVAHPVPTGATRPQVAETAQNQGFSEFVAPVAHVAQKNDASDRAQGSDCWNAADWQSFYWERVGMRSSKLWTFLFE